jgi:hypothetical protein
VEGKNKNNDRGQISSCPRVIFFKLKREKQQQQNTSQTTETST